MCKLLTAMQSGCIVLSIMLLTQQYTTSTCMNNNDGCLYALGIIDVADHTDMSWNQTIHCISLYKYIGNYDTGRESLETSILFIPLGIFIWCLCIYKKKPRYGGNCKFFKTIFLVVVLKFFWFHALQVRPDQGSNSRLPDHDSIFCDTETPAL